MDDHLPGEGPRPARRVVHLCPGDPVGPVVQRMVLDIPDEHLAVAQQRGPEAVEEPEHAPGCGPGAALRVVQLGGRRIGLTAGATHHEYPAIEEPHGGMAVARRAHWAGIDPAPSRLGKPDDVGAADGAADSLSPGVELGRHDAPQAGARLRARCRSRKRDDRGLASLHQEERAADHDHGDDGCCC